MSLKWKIIIGLLLAGAVVAFFYFRSNSNQYLAAQIKKLGGTTGDVSSFDKPFLKAWYKSLTTSGVSQNTFMYQGKMYNTIGGRAVI